MRVSYLGIATPHGFAYFLPEARVTRAFVEHYARRTGRTDFTCFWSVLDRREAKAVDALLAARDSWGALQWLDGAAERVGSFVPAQFPDGSQ